MKTKEIKNSSSTSSVLDLNQVKIESLLRSTGYENIENLLEGLRNSNFYRAQGGHIHHRYVGGMAKHSLQTCKVARVLTLGFHRNEVILCALMHDLGKCFVGHSNYWGHNPGSHHGEVSVQRLKSCGVRLSESAQRAIRWHMLPGERKNDEDFRKARFKWLRMAVHISDDLSCTYDIVSQWLRKQLGILFHRQK